MSKYGNVTLVRSSRFASPRNSRCRSADGTRPTPRRLRPERRPRLGRRPPPLRMSPTISHHALLSIIRRPIRPVTRRGPFPLLSDVLTLSAELPDGVLCHERRPSKRRCATVREMKEGPSVRQSGADLKPPQAAVVKSDGGERCGKVGT